MVHGANLRSITATAAGSPGREVERRLPGDGLHKDLALWLGGQDNGRSPPDNVHGRN